jgi:hypothetical protein
MMKSQGQSGRAQSSGRGWLVAVLLILLLAAAAVFLFLRREDDLTLLRAAATPAPTATASPVAATTSTPAPPLAAAPTAEPPREEVGADKSRQVVNRVEAEFFTIEVVRCKSSGTAIGCDLKITNNGDDRSLFIDTGRLYDNFGNRYEVGARRIANVSGPHWIKVFKGKTVSARVEFNKDSQQAAEGVTALELKFAAEPRGFEVQFRNLPPAPESVKD